ncbi:hypothetical protein NLI96_g8241 [Meripilus lineatus]|uniref:Uncharacterized protein n=1 Tax=Meripilus lineatus TaxID=2056292 RepID=A0AAD5V2B3_9APHY|nr:hypothetical protein NLI96_g8241 [Physisporinus lineatus]
MASNRPSKGKTQPRSEGRIPASSRNLPASAITSRSANNTGTSSVGASRKTTPTAPGKDVRPPDTRGVVGTRKTTPASTSQPIKPRSIPTTSQPSQPPSGAERTRKRPSPVVGTNSKAHSESPIRSRVHPKSSQTQNEIPSESTVTLDVASQVLAWQYMISTLEECHQNTKARVTKQLDEWDKQLVQEEEEIADVRVRFEVERLLDFLDEISDEKHAHEIPKLMVAFLHHGTACQKVIDDALKANGSTQKDAAQLRHCAALLESLGTSVRSVMQQQTLDRLTRHTGRLQEEGSELLRVMTSLGEGISPSSKLAHTVLVLTEVLQSRVANVATACSLVESCRTNLRLHLEIESLKLSS